MVRNFFKKSIAHQKFNALINKYNIPRTYISINRKSITKGIFIGLFIGFIPMPMQMLAVVAVIPFVRFNVPIAISTVWLSNPFTMPAMYYMEYVTGSFFLGTELEPVHMTLEWFRDNFKNIFIPLYVGTLFYSITVSTLAYYLVDHLWKRSVRKEKLNNAQKRKKNMQKHNTIFLKDYRSPEFTITQTMLEFDIFDEYTLVTNIMSVKRLDDKAKELRLDGEELELVSLTCNKETVAEDMRKIDKRSLVLYNVHDAFELQIVTKIYPHKNTQLEGLYKSGGIFCTQNEPEGFRKITYFLDRPDVMAKYTTKVIADKKFPILLSNGNKKEHGEIDANRHFCVWEDPFAKPSYLFALVAGDLGVISDHFTTMNSRKIALNIYCDKGNEPRSLYAMQSLKKAMRWDEEQYGREYDLDIYNIVAVDSFNMGAMENKGLNIFNSHYVLASKETATDQDYMGIESVIAHEYFHNWTGNRITCRDWFQLTLKEGLTVYRDQCFSADMNSKEVVRIENVKMLKERQFVEDSGPTAHPIQPDSYISMNNFYTATVYEKGAEVIGMYHTLLGEENYKKAMQLYFDTFDAQAVTVDDYFWAMEQNYDGDLTQFKRWYHQSGTPSLHVKGEFSDNTLTLTCKQSVPTTVDGKEQLPLMYPFVIGLFDEDGTFLREEKLIIQEEVSEFKFENLQAKPKLSLNRGFKAPIKVIYEEQDYPFLMGYDNDSVNRYESAQAFALEALNTIIDTGEIDAAYLRAFGSLFDSSVDFMYLAHLLELPTVASMMQTRKIVNFQQLCDARDTMAKALATNYKERFFKLYEQNNDLLDDRITADAMAHRAVKNRALSYLAYLKDQRVATLCEEQYYKGVTMNDKISALMLMASHFTDKAVLALEDFYDHYNDNTLLMNKYFAILASSQREDLLDIVIKAQTDSAYDTNVPNLVRALIGSFTRNYRYFHANDGSGYAFVSQKIIEIDAINPQMSSSLAGAFKVYKKLDGAHKELLKEELRRILATQDLSENCYEIVSKILV